MTKDKSVPESIFGEDTSFEKRRHIGKSQTTAGDLKKMEVEGKADTDVKENTTRTIKEANNAPKQFNGKHKGQLGSLLFVMALLLVGVTATILLSPSLLLVNIKENLVNDLNDGTKAYYEYSNKVLDMTSSGGGCDYKNDPSIKCKFQTMSTYMRKNFTKHGFVVSPPQEPDPYDSPMGQIYPPTPKPAGQKQDPPERKGTSVVKDTYGHSISGKLSEAASKDATFRELLYKVFSPRTSLFQDRKFDLRLHDKFDITRDTRVGGSDKDEVYKSFDDAIDNGSGDEYIDLNGQGNYGASKLADSASQWQKIMDNLIQDKNGYKVTSIASMACAYDAYERMSENAIVNARSVTVARYAMNFLIAADSIKAGVANEVTSMSLARMLIRDDDTKSNATDVSSYRTPAMFEPVQGAIDVNNPSNMLSALTMPGSMMGTLKDHLLETFAHGIGLSSPAAPPGDGIYQPKTNDPYGWCTAAQSDPEKFNNEIKFVPGLPPSWYCNVHPQSLTTILGYGLLAVELGLEPIYYISPQQAVACQALEEIPVKLISSTISPLVQKFAEMSFAPARNMTKSTGIPYAKNDPASKDVQDTIFAGTGIILGDMAQSRGLKPVTQKDIPQFMQYLKEAAVIDQQDKQDKMRVARSEPFNIYNPYSFLGMTAQKLFGGGSSKHAATTPLDGITRFLGILGTSVTTMASMADPSSSALFSQPLASQFDTSRLTKCGFNDNSRFWGADGIKIMADFGCNIRYFMPQSALNKDLDSVIEYMTKDDQPKDVDWAQKTVDQLNERNANGRDAPRLAKLKSDAQEGASGAFVDKKTGKPREHTQYAKFLQYCVNRKDPWGAKALAMDPKEPEYTPNPEYIYGKESFSASEDPNNPNQGPEPADSYYALGAGPPIDQDWYTGKNCLEDNAMIDNFRAYTLACSVLAAMSGSRECWMDDEEPHEMPNDFYLSNNILFLPNQSATIGPAEKNN